MQDWLDRLRTAIWGESAPRRRKWLHRRFTLSSSVCEWLASPVRLHEERSGLAVLLLLLDANPIGNSMAVLREDAPRGLRWAPFGQHKAFFIWDPSKDWIRIVLCE